MLEGIYSSKDRINLYIMEKQNFLLKFASKNVKVQSLTFSKGVILWALLAFAYLIFVMNWGFASAGLNGKVGLQKDVGYLGYLGHFFPNASDAPSSVVNQAVNWGITIGRAIGSILVGWLIAKVSHKYAVIISLVFMLFGIAAPYSPSYAGFIILRTILAIGGTMQIVLLQPVVARYMNQRQKALFSKLSPFFYPIGTIITLLPFVKGDNLLFQEQGQWQIVFLVISLLTLIPLIGYIILGAKFDLYPDAVAARQTAEPLSLFKFFKQKDTWVWTLLYGSWLIAVVFPFAFSKPLFHRFIGNTADFTSQINVFIIVFLAGMFVGPFTVGLISQYQLKRRAFIAGVIGFGVLMYILATITFIYGVKTEGPGKYGGYSALFLILGLVMGTCLWGIQGVLLNLPHEYKGANPRKIGYQFGLIWGLGYAFFTIANIITGLVSTPPGVDFKEIGASASLNFASGAYALIIIFSLLAVGAIFLLKEPNPSYASLSKILLSRKFSEITKISK